MVIQIVTHNPTNVKPYSKNVIIIKKAEKDSARAKKSRTPHPTNLCKFRAKGCIH